MKNFLNNFWFINHWGENDIGFKFVIFEIWVDFWAIDVTLLNFTFGVRINKT